MPKQPRHRGWAAVVRATVRVGSGSGVVIRSGSAAVIATAQHVVEDNREHRIRWPEGFADRTVVVRDESNDLAILASPPELEDFAISVVDADHESEIGDDVCASGFPSGWDETHPVLARGVVAGLGSENWVNLDGTWGNSGGPLCRIMNSRPFVVGILLGRAGDVNEKLADLRKGLEQSRGALQAPKAHLAGVNPEWQGLLGVLNIAKEISELMEDHFRTGFLRFAAASDLRKLLA
jgi:Trypsin-like peptidase domain